MVLRNLHVDMTGRYTCEVSTEGSFETAVANANMTVVGKDFLRSFNLWTLIKNPDFYG